MGRTSTIALSLDGNSDQCRAHDCQGESEEYPDAALDRLLTGPVMHAIVGIPILVNEWIPTLPTVMMVDEAALDFAQGDPTASTSFDLLVLFIIFLAIIAAVTFL